MDVDPASLTRGRKLAPSEYSALYTLLGRFFLLELDAESLDVLRAPDMLAILGALEPGFAEYVTRDFSAEDFDNAAAEYCALFVLPGGVTPVAAQWIPGDTQDVGHKLAAAVDRVLDDFGLDIGTTPMGTVPKGHVGLLLSLAGHLYGSDDPDAARHGRDFVTYFIAPFVPAFTSALLARTDHPVYRAVARLLAEVHEFG